MKSCADGEDVPANNDNPKVIISNEFRTAATKRINFFNLVFGLYLFILDDIKWLLNGF